MSATQLTSPCWVPCAPGEQPRREGPHWGSSSGAAEQVDPGETPQPFPAPCWVMTCDGLPGLPCGEELEDPDEGWTVHAENPEELAGCADYAGWEVSPDGTARCEECVDAFLRGTEGNDQ